MTATTISAGDTAWVLVSAALVLLMIPGLALFYAGLVRSRAALNTIMMSVAALGVVTVQWTLVGYSLAFGSGAAVGGTTWFGLGRIGLGAGPYSATIPHLAFAVFQAMFAAITVALISGALVERIRFHVYLIFAAAWTTLVYDPLAHWVWSSDGWLHRLGALDFAGGTVVHVTSGVSALVCCLYLGRRLGHGEEPMTPHSMVLSFIGAALLWVGWFGFNAGSALASGSLATSPTTAPVAAPTAVACRSRR